MRKKSSMSHLEALNFLGTVREMLRRDDYFVPYVWAERQYRSDNYQMGAQGLLEDLFYDTLGNYLLQNKPGLIWVRRTGKEPWDYRFSEFEISHKEAIAPIFTVTWQPGLGPKHNIPQMENVTFSHPINLVYTPKKIKMRVKFLDLLESKSADIDFVSVSYGTYEQKSFKNWPVVAVERFENKIKIINSWKRTEWEKIDFVTLRAILKPDNLSKTELYFVKPTKKYDVHEITVGMTSEIVDEDMPSGMYLITGEDLIDVPLTANNKAHFPDKATVLGMMTSAKAKNQFVSIPIWPTVYAESATPDLYRVQYEQYQRLFRAR